MTSFQTEYTAETLALRFGRDSRLYQEGESFKRSLEKHAWGLAASVVTGIVFSLMGFLGAEYVSLHHMSHEQMYHHITLVSEIAGGVVGGVFFIGLLANGISLLVFKYKRLSIVEREELQGLELSNQFDVCKLIPVIEKQIVDMEKDREEYSYRQICDKAKQMPQSVAIEKYEKRIARLSDGIAMGVTFLVIALVASAIFGVSLDEEARSLALKATWISWSALHLFYMGHQSYIIGTCENPFDYTAEKQSWPQKLIQEENERLVKLKEYVMNVPKAEEA